MSRLLASASYSTGFTNLAVKTRGFIDGRSGHINKFLVLIYHRVAKPEPLFISAVEPLLFDKEMAFISKHYNVRTIEEIVELLLDGKSLPPNCIAITFDDGYRDNYEHALPILKKYNIPATIYLTIGCIGTDKLPWFDEVLYAIRNTSMIALDLPELDKMFTLKDWNEKSQASQNILHFMKRLDVDERDLKISWLYKKLKVDKIPNSNGFMMNWDDVRIMANEGVRFGGHTVSHTILTRMPIHRARKELEISKTEIESNVNQEVTTFAYPNGSLDDFNDDVIKLMEEVGYKAAVTTIPRINTNTNFYEIGRITPWEDYLPSFALRLALYNFGIGS